MTSVLVSALTCMALLATIPVPVYRVLSDVNGVVTTTSATQSKKATSLTKTPDSSRFTYTKLISGLDEPMGMAILPGNDLVVIGRKGTVSYFNHSTKELTTIAQFNVFSGIEDGLLGVAADPDFKRNNWIYFYYAVAGDKNINHLERFELKDKKLVLESKKILLEVPTQRTYCCHSAGYITFGPDGLLYLSIGDNTNAEEIEGHNPIDERPGRELSDGQASTANSNDLRGKILRIRPEVDGTYSIPDGNLFPKDGSQGRPEIFAMGLRNPFRMSVDPKTGYVYWGDVGPDTEINTSEGKLSYDEINQARKPGFFGYPYFLGENVAFPDYDFETKKEGPPKDPLRPFNDSPNNTGIKELPPAQPAFIWYGKGPSKKWPLLGSGGASAMAGPVYYSDLLPNNAPYKLPDYYNGKLFIFDWIRKWILAVSMDEAGNYLSMEPFLPQLKVVSPIDMQIASDGAIYLIAYGSNWFARNTDSGIIRVEYSEGNRNPIASIKHSATIGAVPFKINLSASNSKDHDIGDKLSYEWKIGDLKILAKDLQHTFTKPGTYNVILTVSDQHGGRGSATIQVKAGNTPPRVYIETTANRSFYWDNTPFDYHVQITDKEDAKISPEKTDITFNYLPFGKDLAIALSAGQGDNLEYAAAAKLYATLDCKACHTPETKSIGPALRDISKRYSQKEGSEDFLSRKIIAGGSGSWGTYPMPPHADLNYQDAKKIAGYILSLEKKQKKAPASNNIQLTEHLGKGTEGAYVLQASYTDNGANGIESLTSKTHLVLRHPLMQFEDYEEGNVSVMIATMNTGYVSYIANITNGKYTRFDSIDLNHVKAIRLRVRLEGAGGTVELRRGAVNGPVAGQAVIPAGKAGSKGDWKEISLPISNTIPKNGLGNVFFVFRNSQAKEPLFHLDWMYFENK